MELEQEVVTGETPVIAATETTSTPAPDTASAPADPKPIDSDKETKQALRGVQRRIDELTRARYEAEERGKQEAEHWKRQAYEHAQKLQEIQRAAPGPKLDQYQDIEQYSAAVARFEAEKLVTERFNAERQSQWERQQTEQQQRTQYEQQQRFQAVVQEKIAEATKQYPDFMDVVTSPELPGLQGTAAFNAILDSELGAKVMYYLGKNPAKAHQIVALSPIGQVREIGRIEAAISAGRTVTGAPPPAETVGGGKGGATKDPAKMSYDEFVSYRRRQIAQRR